MIIEAGRDKAVEWDLLGQSVAFPGTGRRPVSSVRSTAPSLTMQSTFEISLRGGGVMR